MQVVTSLTYTKLKEIGAGQGMNSKVYLADDPQLGGQVAVKEIDKKSLVNLGRTVAEYFAEAQTMFQTEHVNVVAIRYACETPDLICLAMPYFRRGSLADRIQHQPLALGEVLRVARGVLAGLASIHIAKYIHFDIKPSNVLFSNKDVPMVADFGQSRSFLGGSVVKAPPLYRRAFPPETVATSVGTLLADIYQMGLLLYRVLNGDQFYSSQVPSDQSVLLQRITSGKFPDRGHFMPHVPKRLRTIVRRALSVDPAHRYQSATEMADALNKVRLQLDWKTEPFQQTGFRWTAARDGKATLVVELEQAGQGQSWNVRTFTDQGGRRARDKAGNWRSGLSLTGAHAHLKGVFEGLQG